MQDPSSLTRGQSCAPLHWELRVLTTGPLGMPFLKLPPWLKKVPSVVEHQIQGLRAMKTLYP